MSVDAVTRLDGRRAVDAAALAPVLEPAAPGACCRPPPTSTTTVLAWERRHLFAGAWVCVGRGRRARRRRAPGGRSPSATTPCCSCAATTAGCAASSTCASTAATSWPRAGRTSRAPLDPLPVPRLALRARRHAAVDAAVRGARRVRPRRARPRPGGRGGVARLGAWSTSRATAPPVGEFLAGLEELVAAVRAGAPRRRGHPPLRDRGQLEARRRELPGVLPLPEHPPRAVPGEPVDERRELRRPRRDVGRRLAGADAPRRDDVARRPVRGGAAARPRRRRPRGASSTSACCRTCSSACTPTT